MSLLLRRLLSSGWPRRAMCDVSSSSSMSVGSSMLLTSSAISDVNFLSSMPAMALMISSAFSAMMPSKAVADVNFLLRCLQLTLDAIFSSCDGMVVVDVNSSFRCLPASRCCADSHCMSPRRRREHHKEEHRGHQDRPPLSILHHAAPHP